MDRPFRSSEFPAITNPLIFAKKLLLLAVLLEALLLLPTAIVYKYHLFAFVTVTSAVCGIVGFLIAYKVLDLKGEALTNSSLPYLVGPRLKAYLIFFFMLAFLVPILNLIIIIWTYVKSSMAINRLNDLLVEAIAKEKQKSRLQGGIADAFRTPPF